MVLVRVLVDYIPWTIGPQARTFVSHGQAVRRGPKSTIASCASAAESPRSIARTASVRRESGSDLCVPDRTRYRQPVAFGAVQALDGPGRQSAGTLFEGRLIAVGIKARSCLDDCLRRLPRCSLRRFVAFASPQDPREFVPTFKLVVTNFS